MFKNIELLQQHGSLATPTKILGLKLNKEETKITTFLNKNIHAQRQGVHVLKTRREQTCNLTTSFIKV